MQIALKFVELHAPLFLEGKNFGLKIGSHKHDHVGLEMIYDRTEKEILFTWKGVKAIVPISNVASMTPKEIESEEKQEKFSDHLKEKYPGLLAGSAQVSTPQSHVFAGAGHGETGQEKLRLKPGPKPKG